MHGSEGSIKDRSTGASLGRNLHGGGSFGATICQRELDVDRVDSQVPDGVPPSVGAADHKDDGETRGRRRVGVPISRRVNGSSGDPLHMGVHQ